MFTCQCGCNSPIPNKPHHAWKPPKFLIGHSGKGKTAHPNSLKALKENRPLKWTKQRRLNSLSRKYATGVGASNWRGGVQYRNGYRHLYLPDHPFADKHKSYPEHRLVVEKALGRILKKEERVHHLNLDKLDNREENLILFENERQHQLFHDYFEKEAIRILGNKRIKEMVNGFLDKYRR